MKAGITIVTLFCLHPSSWVGWHIMAGPTGAAFSQTPKEKAAEHNRLAGEFFRQARYREAIVEFERSLKVNSRQVPVIKLLGLCHQLSGDLAAAERAFLEASKQNPGDAEVWFYLARVYWIDNFFDKALRAVEVSLKLNQRDWRSQELAGLTFEAEGQFEHALAALRRAVRLNEESSRRWYSPPYNCGSLLRKLGRHEEAEKLLLRARELAPGEWGPHFELGQLYRSTGRLGEAIAAFHNALRTGSAAEEDSARIYRILAHIYFQLGREREARDAAALAEKR